MFRGQGCAFDDCPALLTKAARPPKILWYQSQSYVPPAVPSQNRVVVAGRAEGFGFLRAFHGVSHRVVGNEARAGPALLKQSSRAPLGDNPGIIEVFVLAAQVR